MDLIRDQSSLSWSLVALIAFAVFMVVCSYNRLTRQAIPTLHVGLSEGDHILLIPAQPARASKARIR